MNDLQTRLDKFRNEVNWNLACGSVVEKALAVTSNDGGCPVVVALEEETMSSVFGRLRAVGGAANLFVQGDGRVRGRRLVCLECEGNGESLCFTDDGQRI